MKELLISALMLLGTSLACGQRLQTPTLSPITKITQQVGLTEIGLEYSRPSAKNRTVFGDLVPFGEVWRTGANASTKITLNEAVQIGGHAIEAGTYALYTIPQPDTWTIIIHGNTKLRSLAGNVYQSADDLFRFEVPAQKSTDYVESFTLQFANLGTETVDLELRWANTLVVIPFHFEVAAKVAAQMKQLLQSPDQVSHRIYFQAAEYNLHNDADLTVALAWINAALALSAKDPRYGLLKAKILAKRGDHAAALETINQAYDWAVETHNANYTEQTQLFRDSLR